MLRGLPPCCCGDQWCRTTHTSAWRLQVVAVRITKPQIPVAIKENYEAVESLKARLLVLQQEAVRGGDERGEHRMRRSSVVVVCVFRKQR